jgi:hypothetical protein
MRAHSDASLIFFILCELSGVGCLCLAIDIIFVAMGAVKDGYRAHSNL